MKMLKQVSAAAVASALLLAQAPLVMANEAASASVSSPAMPAPSAVPFTPSAIARPIADKTVMAEPKITKEQAIELVKSYVTIPGGYTLQSVNLTSNSFYGSSGVFWSLNFGKLVEGKQYGSINATIDGITGKLADYSSYSNDPDYKPSYPPKVGYSEAKQIAAEWIEKLNPEHREALAYNDVEEQSFKTPLNGSYQYPIRYDRVHNGIPYPENGVTVQVNGDGEVTHYSYNWDEDVQFEQAAPIGDEAAAKAFRDKAPVRLSYLIPYEAKGDTKPVIAYQLEPFMLDAQTGERWSGAATPPPQNESLKPLTDAPLSAPSAGNLNLTKDQAIEKVTSTFKLPEGVKLEDASFNEFTNPMTGEVQSTWSLSWSQHKDADSAMSKVGAGVWASVNSKTGEIVNFSRYSSIPYGEQQLKEPKVSADEAKTQAIELVKKLLPAYTDQLVLDVTAMDSYPPEFRTAMPNWEVSFKRVIDGVFVNYEGVSLSIGKENGEIMGFNVNFSTFAYPKKKPDVISEDKATELLLSPYVVKLSYVSLNPSTGPIPLEKVRVMMAAGELPPDSATDSKEKAEAKLVYTLVSKYSGEPYFLDAVTGQWRNMSNGEIMSLEKIAATDIDGHWAQRELQIMLDYQALDVMDGKVSPDASITRGELIKMLVIAMNGGRSGIYYEAGRAASFADVKKDSPYFAFVENAVDRGLIDRGQQFNPQEKMTREGMASLIVRALGFKKLAEYGAIFNDDFADAGALSHPGEAAIVTGLGIMSLDGGSFNPQQEVTRAQAAVAFFRYLEKRAALQPDRGYYYY
jgi:hypothetical protein